MRIEDGKTYLAEDGHTYRMKLCKLPVYKFGADMRDGVPHDAFGENWLEDGTAYHYDCGYNLISEES